MLFLLLSLSHFCQALRFFFHSLLIRFLFSNKLYFMQSIFDFVGIVLYLHLLMLTPFMSAYMS